VIAIGDVHGQWPDLWAALRAAGAATASLEPTPNLLSGRLVVVLSGDLVHFKNPESYARAIGTESFDSSDPQQLRRAAKAQFRELYRFKDFVAAAGHVSVILGNHDEVALSHRYILSTRGGLEHLEFDPTRGGLEVPDELGSWLAGFPREKVVHGVQFAHAGPLPGMQIYDDFFYHDPDTKGWWRDKPELARQCGHRFGVYGHTVMAEGIYLDRDYGFAMIDALERREYLELDFENDELYVSVVRF
jgi:hypothetical protein